MSKHQCAMKDSDTSVETRCQEVLSLSILVYHFLQVTSAFYQKFRSLRKLGPQREKSRE